MESQVQPDTNQTYTVAGEAKRGAHNARAFLAENPPLNHIRVIYIWTIDDEAAEDGYEPGVAYARAYRQVLRDYIRQRLKK
jgi:hypothetical protein